MQTVKNDIKFVEDIALRISMDTKSIRNRLSEIENQPEKERVDAIRAINQNFGLLVEDMANQLNKTALKLNPKKPSDTTSMQKSPNKKARKLSRISSSTEDEESDSDESSSHRRVSHKMKRRRKLARSRANLSSGASSNSEDLPNRNIKDEPFVISQDLDELMNGTSNSANESLTKEKDLLGFDHLNDMEVGIKTDAMLNSDPAIISPDVAKSSNKCPNQSSTDVAADENSIPNESNEKLVNVSMNSALEPMNEESAGLSPSGNDDIIDNDGNDSDDDDEEISRLLDYKSIENRRTASTNADAKINGTVQSAKKAIKKPEKEDELEQFLTKNSDDTEKTMESDEEKSELPEEKEKYTEEQYLKEQNEKLKEQLLQSSSESEENLDDSDDIDDAEDRVNGKI